MFAVIFMFFINIVCQVKKNFMYLVGLVTWPLMSSWAMYFKNREEATKPNPTSAWPTRSEVCYAI